MNKSVQYNLVHITTGGEYKAPLVASQLFDQAETQALNKQDFAPLKVEAWIIGNMREYFEEEAKKKVLDLKKRCPHVSIRMINGIGKLNGFPISDLMKIYRRNLDSNVPVIYHCRGERAVQHAFLLKQGFPKDKIILDVRGYWPAESIYRRGIDDPTKATGIDLDEYNKAHAYLKDAINKADAVTTVSEALKGLLIKEVNAPSNTSVVPCCVMSITGDEKRAEIRKSWGIKDNEIVLVYSGTTAAYQHLDDLTIPFLKKIVEKNNKVRLAFFSSEQEKIKAMLEHAGMDVNNIILKNFPQNAVNTALTACDVGILIRKPTLVNRVANPVKIAEYMAAGLPMIIEKGVGGISDILFERSLLKEIEIAIEGNNTDITVTDVNDWLDKDIKGKREFVRAYARDVYLWSSAIHVSRKMYKTSLQ